MLTIPPALTARIEKGIGIGRPVGVTGSLALVLVPGLSEGGHAVSREYCWGVDFKMSQIAFGFAPVDGHRAEAQTLQLDNELREGARLGHMDRQVRVFACGAAREFPPACVWVEQPSGQFRNLQLAYAAGVIQAALFESLACPVWTLPSSKWKAALGVPGNATKSFIQAWAVSRGHLFDGEHEADAVGIAVAGRLKLKTRRWDAKAAA